MGPAHFEIPNIPPGIIQAALVLSVLFTMLGCFQSTTGHGIVDDEMHDAQEIQEEIGNEADAQEGSESSDDDIDQGDGSTEGHEACPYATIELIPSFYGASYIPAGGSCEDWGGEEGIVDSFMVFVFQGDTLVREELLSCLDNKITVESIPPGEYEIAVHAGSFLSGLQKLTLVFPELPVTCNTPACCPPAAVTAAPCETIRASIAFCCLEYDCFDCCGY